MKRRKIESKKDMRETENFMAIGGMRNPARAVRRLPALRIAGAKMRQVLEQFINDFPGVVDVVADVTGASWKKFDAENGGILRQRLADALGGASLAVGPGSKWRADLVRAFVEAANDPDTALPKWLSQGAPTGVAVDIEASGIFPAVESIGKAYEELQKSFATVHPGANYASVEAHRELVAEEFERLVKLGYARRYGSWAEVTGRLGDVVVSKVAAIVKGRPDGTTKLRLIIDMLRSCVNQFVRLHERVVLPRLGDVVSDLLDLIEALPDGGSQGSEDFIDMMVVDWADAFQTMGVLESEFPHQVVRGTRPDEFFGFETVVFGGGGSPGVWGRAAAFLGRSGQALFDYGEARLQVYVDDPWTAWVGRPEIRRRNRAVLLLWWLAIGPELSWAKMEIGRKVRWIGASIEVAVGAAIVALPEDFLEKLAKEVQEAEGLRRVPLGVLRPLAGRAAWAGGIVPFIKPMIAPLWAAIRDVEGGHVPAPRVAHALRWLRAFLRRQRGVVRRVYPAHSRRAHGALLIEVDASPWGFGGVLWRNGVPVEWFAEPVTRHDVERFNLDVGESKHQALLEVLAILIAARLWRHRLTDGRAGLVLRSDSEAALGAAGSLKSPVPEINAVVREIALDLAEAKYQLDVLEHIPGALNIFADALSRRVEPGKVFVLPGVLKGVTEAKPAKRNESFWETWSR